MSLGRGLGALITPTTKGKKVSVSTNASVGNLAPDKLWQIPLTEITPKVDQPRKYFDPQALNELSESIKEHGVIQPIILNEKRSGGYEIIAGERRFRASKLAGLTTVPAVVKQYANQKVLELSLIENIQRENLNPIEEAFAYKRLIDEFNLTQEVLATKVGKSRPAISNTIRLLDLPDEVQKALIEGQINTGQARALLSLKNKQEQLTTLSSMLGQKISVRDLEKNIQQRKPLSSARRDPNIIYAEQKIRSALGTKVNITQKGSRGVISISYYSQEELAKIISNITGE